MKLIPKYIMTVGVGVLLGATYRWEIGVAYVCTMIILLPAD